MAMITTNIYEFGNGSLRSPKTQEPPKASLPSQLNFTSNKGRFFCEALWMGSDFLSPTSAAAAGAPSTSGALPARASSYQALTWFQFTTSHHALMYAGRCHWYLREYACSQTSQPRMGMPGTPSTP